MATTNLKTAEFEGTVNKEGIVLMDFWAEWCGPCRQFGPIFEKVSEGHEDITFAKVDTEAEQQLAADLQITSIPTLMAFRDGMLVFREAGALPENSLEDLIKQVRDLDMDEVKKSYEEQQKAQANS